MSTFELPGELIPGSTGYICVICENPLIATVEASCKHKFCKHCIGIWRKHRGFCPVCTQEVGTLLERPDIDELIEGFFGTADAVVQQTRINTIRSREEATESIFGNSNKNEMNALMDYLKPPQTAHDVGPNHLPPRTATTSASSGTDKKKEMDRLRRDNEKFERELNVIYSKILTTGARLTAREDMVVARLCGIPVTANGSAFCTSPETGKPGKSCRPYTVVGNFATKEMPTRSESKKISKLRHGTSCTTKADLSGGFPLMASKFPKEELEIDALIELTEDVLRIDNFLNVFNFDKLTQSEGIEEDAETDEQDDAVSVVHDKNPQRSTDHFRVESFDDSTSTISHPDWKIHPEVIKNLEKLGLSADQFIPKRGGKTCPSEHPTDLNFDQNGFIDGGESGIKIRGQYSKGDVRTPSQGTTGGEGAICGKPSTTNIELTSKIVQCRESLLNLKHKAAEEQESQAKMGFKPGNIFGGESRIAERNFLEKFDGPMGSLEIVEMGQGPLGDGQTVGRIGREVVRPSIRSITLQQIPRRPQTSAPSKMKHREKPSKEDIGSVTSLPMMTTREIDRNQGTGNRARPYTAAFERKKLGGYPGFPR